MKQRLVFIVLLVTGLIIGVMANTRPGKPQKPWKRQVIDAHSHLSPWAMDRVRQIMKDNDLIAMVNMSGGYYGSRTMMGCLQMQKAMKGREFNCYTPQWSRIDEPDFGYVEAARLRFAVEKLGYKCLKISKVLGLYVRDNAGVIVAINDSRLDPLWTEAGLLGVPVYQHVADPKAFFKPCDKTNERYAELKVHPYWCFYGKDYFTYDEMMEQFEDEIRRHPETDIIGVHFGNDAEDPDNVARMLETYPNYYIDIAARVPEFGRHPAKLMRRFFIKYQDRILFATDIGVGRGNLMLGSGDGTVKTMADARKFYAQIYKYFETNLPAIDSPTPIQGNWKIFPVNLPKPVLDKIYRLNAIRLDHLDLAE